MTTTELVTLILSVLGAVGAGARWMWNAVEARRISIAQAATLQTESKERDIAAKFVECQKSRDELQARILAVEVTVLGDVPKWMRDQHGRIISVSYEFVRVFGAAHGYTVGDMIGKTFDQLTSFSDTLRKTLVEMDADVLRFGYADRSQVEICAGVTATIIKTSRASPSGDVVFVGYAVPHYEQ